MITIAPHPHPTPRAPHIESVLPPLTFPHLSSHFVNKIRDGEKKKKKDKLRRRFEGLLLLGQ